MSDLSKELLSRADAIFGKIAEATASAGTFAMEQLPDIALQFILYNRVMYTLQMLVGIVLIYLALRLHKTGITTRKTCFRESGDDGFAYHVAAMPVWLVASFVNLSGFSPFLMVWFAPKIFLITELVKLVKG